MTGVLWLRRDLRLGDHPALHAAAAEGDVLALVVLDPRLLGDVTRPRTAAYLRAVSALNDDLDGDLVVRHGDPCLVLPQVCREAGARAVHVSAESTPGGRRRDARVRRLLAAIGAEWVATGSPYAVGPGRIRTRAGEPYQVFTAFARAWRAHGWPAPPDRPPHPRWSRSVASEAIPAVPPESARGDTPVTEREALLAWETFCVNSIGDYEGDRDRTDRHGTSRLSIALKLGTIHPRTLLTDLSRRGLSGTPGGRRFVTELAWREFYADVLWHHPDSAWRDLSTDLAAMIHDDPRTDPIAARRFAAWQQGRTGYPIVDAGMRQLATTGWMHNRVRMITASFLTKDLHIWWPHGARHFLDRLTDGDLASNSHGWQWVAGTGTDAAPYFRVFNPTTQARRFDPHGDYVRTHVPELRHLGGDAVHEPWSHPHGLAHGYPDRIVDHAGERLDALERYAAARRAAARR